MHSGEWRVRTDRARLIWAVVASFAMHVLVFAPDVVVNPILEGLGKSSAGKVAPPSALLSEVRIIPRVQQRPMVSQQGSSVAGAGVSRRVRQPEFPRSGDRISGLAAGARGEHERPATRQARRASGEDAGVVSQERPDGAVDEEDFRRYRLAIAVAAGRVRKDAQLSVQNLNGTVTVMVTASGKDGAPRVFAARSSGHAALDAAAVGLVSQAVRIAIAPAQLRNKAFALELPVTFEASAED